MFKIPVILALFIFATAISAEEPTPTEWHRVTIEEVFPGLVGFDGQIRYYKRGDRNLYMSRPFPTSNTVEFLASLEPFEAEPNDSMKYLKAWIKNDSLKYLLYYSPKESFLTLCAFSPDTVDAINESNGFVSSISPVGVYRWVSIFKDDKLIRKICCCSGTMFCGGSGNSESLYKGDLIYDITDLEYFSKSGKLRSLTNYKNYKDIDKHDWLFKVEYDEEGNCVFFNSKDGFIPESRYCPRPRPKYQ